jgi:FAD/FMN-containing dehydrogenase
VGRFVAQAPYTHRYDWVRVYCASTASRREDFLTTEDYYFRYDRGVTNTHPHSLLARLLFGPWLTSSRVLWLAEHFSWLLPAKSPNVTVDTFVPMSRVEAFLDWYRREVAHWPVWVVPYRRVRDYEWVARDFFSGFTDRLFLDLAVYGARQPPGRNLYREIEEALQRVGGIKTLISHNFYSADEFWRLWNRENYRQVKQRVDPQNVFRDLYEKMCPAAARSLSH